MDSNSASCLLCACLIEDSLDLEQASQQQYPEQETSWGCLLTDAGLCMNRLSWLMFPVHLLLIRHQLRTPVMVIISELADYYALN